MLCNFLTDSKICIKPDLSDKHVPTHLNDSGIIEETFKKVQNFNKLFKSSLNPNSKILKIYLLEKFKIILIKLNFAIYLNYGKYMCRKCVLEFITSFRIIFDTSPSCFTFCNRPLNWPYPFRIEKFKINNSDKKINGFDKDRSVLFRIVNFGNFKDFFTKTASNKNKLFGNSLEKGGKFNTPQMAAFNFENFINLRRKKRKVSYSSSSSFWRKNFSSRLLKTFAWEGEDKTILLPTNYPSVAKFYNEQENATKNSLNSEVRDYVLKSTHTHTYTNTRAKYIHLCITNIIHKRHAVINRNFNFKTTKTQNKI